jgi:uncharacterized membrane protein YkvA (DUF1232 family)
MSKRNRQSNPGALMTLFNRLALSWRLVVDRRVNIGHKLIPILAVAYLLSPIDVIPDFLLPVGVVDDIGVAILALEFFIRMAPSEVVREHLKELQRRAAGGSQAPQNDEDVIEGEYTIHDR